MRVNLMFLYENGVIIGSTVSFTLLTTQRQKLRLVNSQSEDSDRAKGLKLSSYAHIYQNVILKFAVQKLTYGFCHKLG